MALNKREVTVLCPNGRRVTVKSTSSTSIGQIIEEACLKQKLDPLNYNLKHLKRILDPSNTIQYSNIPNRAQLELIEADKRRQELNVTVNLITEEGLRLIAEFTSSTTLEEMLVIYESNPENEFSLPDASSGLAPFVVYTMRKFLGEELKSATLKSLGLYGGRCVMRYGTQQHLPENCSKTSASSPIVIVTKKTESPSISSNLNDKTSSADSPCTSEPMDCDVPQEQESSSVVRPPTASEIEDNKASNDLISEDDPILNQSEDNCVSMKEEHVNTSIADEIETSIVSSSSDYCDKLSEVTESETSVEETIAQELESPASKGIPLGDHDSILFSLDDAPPTVQTEESDDFFDLSHNEVLALHIEKVRQTKELEDAPLMTNQFRQMEKKARVLTALHDHPITQLRICFPDRHVIQATFKPFNKVKEVKDFLRPLLIRRDLEFNLGVYGQKALNPETTLVEAKCVPKSRLDFTSEEKLSTYLSEETLSKKSTFEEAAKSICKSKRSKNSRIQKTDNHGKIPEAASSNSVSQNANQNRSIPDVKLSKFVKLSK